MRRKIKEVLMKKGKTAIFFSLSYFLCRVVLSKHTQYCHPLILFNALLFSRDAGDENKSQENSTGKTTYFAKSVIFYD